MILSKKNGKNLSMKPPSTNNCYNFRVISVDRIVDGDTIYLNNENLIDNITAISGSGPGYIFYLVEALSQIGVDQGLSIKDAKTIARETLIGSARLVETSNDDPKTLKENVTSPGGTTEAGLQILESKINGLYPLLKSTINNAIKRAKELNSHG